jgi:N-acetyl-anhydromuramyl-L-alanine amidase AmpD
MPQTDYAPALWRPSPNKWEGRQGHRITGIVVHATAGLEPGPVEWFQTPASQVSAHYIVNRDGTVVQTVREADSAWHAGEMTPDSRFYGHGNKNLDTIGVEHERDASNSSPLTAAQLYASLALVRSILHRHGPLEIIPHDAIDVGRVCPGPGFPLSLFRAAAGAFNPPTLTKEQPRVKHFPALYAQRDARWASQRLGTADGITLGQYGCYVTSMAMLACYYGHPITPAALDDLYTARQIYVNGDMMPDDALHRAFPDLELVAVHDYSNVPADLGVLRSIAADPALMAIVGLDFDHNPSDGIQTHFSPLADCDGAHVQLADTWYGGVIADMTVNYGPDPASTIQKVVVYRGPAPAAPSTPAASAPTAASHAIHPGPAHIISACALKGGDRPSHKTPALCQVAAGQAVAVLDWFADAEATSWARIRCLGTDGKPYEGWVVSSNLRQS